MSNDLMILEYKDGEKPKPNDIVNCECGGKFKWRDKSNHFKTYKHNKYKENKKNFGG